MMRDLGMEDAGQAEDQYFGRAPGYFEEEFSALRDEHPFGVQIRVVSRQ